MLKTAMLTLGPGQTDVQLTEQLGKAKLQAKNQGSFDSAMRSAGFYAKKLGETMFLYQGNSYMHLVWRVSSKPRDYLNSINNTGETVLSVTPDLVVSRHKVR